MSEDNSFLYLLFSNLHNLLQRDLKVYKMHQVEDEYFKDALNLFKDVDANIQSFADSKNFSSIDLTNLYALPNIIRTYDRNREYLHGVLPSQQKDRRIFFKIIYKYLDQYYETKKLDQKTKEILCRFFLLLSKLYDNSKTFEVLEDSNMMNNSRKHQMLEYAE